MKTYNFSSAILRMFMATCLVFHLAACGIFIKKPIITQKTSLKKLDPADYPEFTDHLFFEHLGESIQRSLAYFHRIPPDRIFYFDDETFTTRHMIASLEVFQDFIRTKNPSKYELNQFISSNYLVFKSVGGNRKNEMLFTGYYEPVIQGSLSKSDEYCYPIYAVPPDLVRIDLSLFSSRFSGEKIVGRVSENKVLPYYDRQEIEQGGALADSAEILAWTNNPIDLFFLQIQGSGKIELEDGSTLNIHYHASNGHPYRSIGRLLIDEGKILKEQMSMQKIREYLNENPNEVERILNYNKSYVFFKLEANGPIGSLQEQLTEMRSIALDQRIFPRGALAYMETFRPEFDEVGQIFDWIEFKGFVLHQDTGGAIRGPDRADLFWGSGPRAKLAAGHMQHPGTLYFLVLRPDKL